MSGFSVSELATSLSLPFKIVGKKDKFVKAPSNLHGADYRSFTFCNKHGEEAFVSIKNTKAGVVVCSTDFAKQKNMFPDKTLICVENPRLAFIEILQKFFAKEKQFLISPTAVIDENADIHENVSIGPHSYIGDCKIGEGTIIYGNVFIYSNVTIGKNVTIHSGTTIGVEDAFAYERNQHGELVKFPHFGGVIIEDDVDIHAHANIDRGTFGNTIIGRGSKINRYAHIGHNSVIGKHCQIGGQVFIAGSSIIGDYCELALCSCIRNGTKLGQNVMIGMGSVVTKDIEDDWVAYGVPAKKIQKNEIPPWRTSTNMFNPCG
jgi:UDP-3-O-[3-hydroxymyristoyl] glucosamine N-acyltransferase